MIVFAFVNPVSFFSGLCKPSRSLSLLSLYSATIMDDHNNVDDGDSNNSTDVAPALISVHPAQNSVAVAVGSDLRVFDLRGGYAVSLVDESDANLHKDSIRAIRYSSNGQIFASAGDDKIVKLWWTESWRCIGNVVSEKRVTAVSISNDGRYVCFADKFGVIWGLDLTGVDGNQVLLNNRAVPLLSHYCSIITSLEFSPDGQFIISADRDFKIRVTVFPKKLSDGAHEIQSFCLGHSEFVSCLSFICTTECLQGFLISGSGDSTVRLWDISSGSLLDTCEVGEKVECLEGNDREECHSAVTAICTTTDGAHVAVAVQSFQGIMLLSCDISLRTLSIIKVITISDETYIPTSIGTSSSTGLLWMVTGVSNLHGFEHSPLARIRVIPCLKKSDPDSIEDKPSLMEDSEIPGGEKLLVKLQGSLLFDKKISLAAAEAVKTAMSNLLIKKQYCAGVREIRKRTRNDRKSRP